MNNDIINPHTGETIPHAWVGEFLAPGRFEYRRRDELKQDGTPNKAHKGHQIGFYRASHSPAKIYSRGAAFTNPQAEEKASAIRLRIRALELELAAEEKALAEVYIAADPRNLRVY